MISFRSGMSAVNIITKNTYGKKKKAKSKETNPYYFLNEGNEFGGLLQYNGSVRLYEGEKIKDIPVLNG